jgi:sulfide:quinone oxidoreductase
VRDRIELVYATPLDGAFTKPAATRVLTPLLERKGIHLETEFSTGDVDAANRKLVSYDGREVPYDLLVSIPTHSGASFIEASGLGNELGFVPTDPATLRSKHHENNLERTIGGRSLDEGCDGHANCFVETGHGRAMLIDFNYAVEPLPGVYPLPVVGPFRLLAESRVNHLGKLAFRTLYWNALLPARSLPISHRMSMAGKHRLAPEPEAKGADHAAA